SREHGMQTFDQHLFELYETGEISYEEALRNADSVNDLRINIKLNSKRARTRDLMSEAGDMEIVEDEDKKMGGLVR
ncbi:MAG: type IV pili twitching motility protein PilT, partial [Halothiobacillaceae bacterium]|nr:type IV pili twitching motility protein PilT [Halothiobacillaceae bacterium]